MLQAPVQAPSPPSTISAQLAEGLLAVIWLDRCRQVQLLAEGGAHRAELIRAVLLPFIVEQRWGFEPGVVDDAGARQAAGVLKFEATSVAADHVAEEMIFNKIIMDIEAGAWQPIEGYMRRADFFGGFPPGSLRRLPAGAPSR